MVIFKGPPSKGKLPRSPSRMWILRMTILCAESMAFGKPFIVGHEKVILDLWLLRSGLENGGKPLVPLETMTIGARCFNPRCRYFLGCLGKMTSLQSILLLLFGIACTCFRLLISESENPKMAISQWSWIPLGCDQKQAALQPCCSFFIAFFGAKTSRPRPSCVCQHWMAVVGYNPNGSLMTFRTWR